MAKIEMSTRPLLEQSTDALAVFVEQDAVFSQEVQDIAAMYFPSLQAVMKKRNFTGKALSSLVLSTSTKTGLVDLIFVGLGKRASSSASIDHETYRRALGSIIRAVESRRSTSVAIHMPPSAWMGMTDHECAKETATIVEMASYHFDHFISDKERKLKDIVDIVLVIDKQHEAVFKKGLVEGQLIGNAVNATRYWVDLPPHYMTPIHLAEKARQVAQDRGLKCTVFNEAEINEMGMGGLAGVSVGSERDCQFVILEYKSPKKDAQTVCLVGKGITFDSGGLSIKPATAMETMKDDMAGAAAVISAMDVLAVLKPDVNVIGITPLSENLPSGKATKPGDVITFYNGVTAEVKNTDAEGRLILADALAYGVKHYNPDVIVDIATLTGAISYALGPFFTGLMTQHDEVAKKLEASAQRTGDRVWRLPLHDDYKASIKSSLADICNIGNERYRAGSITGAFFLQNFVGNTPWAHLDIAGTAFNVPDMPYFRSEGATGAGVRLFVDFVMNWK